MAEEAADDEALYDVWRRVAPEDVRAAHVLVAALVIKRARGGRPTADQIADAMALRDGPLGLGFLPVVSDVLSNSLAGPMADG